MFWMSIGCGLGTALGWGFADLASKKVVDRMGVYASLLIVQTLITLLVSMLWTVFWVHLVVQSDALIMVFLASFLLMASWPLFYTALSKGLVSIICAIYPMFAIIPFIWQWGNQTLHPSVSNLVSVGIMLMSAILVSIDLSELRKSKKMRWAGGIGEVVLALICSGAVMILGDTATRQIGWQSVYFFEQIFALPILFLIVLAIGKLKHSRIPTGRYRWWTGAIAIGQIVAFSSLTFGMERGYIGIVTVVSSFSAAVTAVLAALFLKERLAFNQYAGIALGIVGLIGLSL